MPDVDPLAFDIRFALTHKPIGREARKPIARGVGRGCFRGGCQLA